MKTMFWAPVHGQCCNSIHAALVSSFIAVTRAKSKTLIFHNQFEHSTMEGYLGIDGKVNDNIEKGIDPLISQTKAGQIEKDEIRYYADTYLSGGLDILTGTNQTLDAMYSDIDQIYKDIMNVADLYYDNVIIDTHSGFNYDLTTRIVDAADLVVVSINQNAFTWKLIDQIKRYIPHENYVFVVGSYSKNSRATTKKIAKEIGVAESKVKQINYSDIVKDHANTGKLFSFVYSNINASKEDDAYDVIQDLKAVAQMIDEHRPAK